MMSAVALVYALSADTAAQDKVLRAAETALKDYQNVGLFPTADVIVSDCRGEHNAYYLGWLDAVVMCTPDAEWTDEALRFVAAHELAHAVVTEYHVPDEDPEAGADELAAIVLLANGDRDALVKFADLAMSFPNPHPGDAHPANMVRARQALCLDDGFDGDAAADQNCALYYRRAVASWMRALEGRSAE